MKKIELHWQILIALAFAVIIGSFTDKNTILAGSITYFSIYDFLGKLFLNALKMIIVPLVVSSVIVSVSGIKSNKRLGILGLKTFVYYAFTSLIAILTGLILVNLIHPGSETLVSQMTAKPNINGNLSDIANVFIRMIPSNPLKAAIENQMLGLIFFSLLFGIFMRHVKEDLFKTMYSFWDGILNVMLNMTDFIMKFAPIGVFALVAKVISETGFDSFKPLLAFFLTVLSGLAIHTFISLPLLLIFVAKINPIKHFKAMYPALLTAFSTSSSMATLSVTLDDAQKRASVSPDIAGFVLPLGATVNMDGTALYECVAAVFIAQSYGISMPITTQFTVLLLALLTSVGVAGVPSASLVAIIIILSAVGLPVEAIGLILVVDRLLDMTRTAVNVWSDSCGAAIISESEKKYSISN